MTVIHSRWLILIAPYYLIQVVQELVDSPHKHQEVPGEEEASNSMNMWIPAETVHCSEMPQKLNG